MNEIGLSFTSYYHRDVPTFGLNVFLKLFPVLLYLMEERDWGQVKENKKIKKERER